MPWGIHGGGIKDYSKEESLKMYVRGIKTQKPFQKYKGCMTKEHTGAVPQMMSLFRLSFSNTWSAAGGRSPTLFFHWPKLTVLNQLFTFDLQDLLSTALWSWTSLSLTKLPNIPLEAHPQRLPPGGGLMLKNKPLTGVLLLRSQGQLEGLMDLGSIKGPSHKCNRTIT